MAKNAIFREASLERLSTPDRLDAGLTVVNTAGWALIWGLGLLIGGGLIWAALVIVPVTVKGDGILLSPGGVLDVTTGSAGRVRQFVAQIGDVVRVDQVVAEVDQPQIRQDLDAAEGELKDAIDLRARTADFQKRRQEARAVSTGERRRTLHQSITVLTENNKMLTEQASIREDFSKRGLSTRDKYLESKLELGRQQAELARNQVDLAQMDDEEVRSRTDDEKELLALDQKIASAERRAIGLRERLDFESRVKSPYDGRIAELKVNVGELVERGTSLFTVLPENSGTVLPAAAAQSAPKEFGSLVAVVYVPPSFGKQVQAGDAVQVAISTARREEYGFVMGRVRLVADIPSTAEGMQRVLKNKQLVQTLSNNAAPFEVLIDLYSDRSTPSGYRWSSSRGPSITLNGGTLVNADIEVRSVPILALAVPQVRQLLERVFPPARAASATDKRP
jgi:HlyD family secretion protein